MTKYSCYICWQGFKEDRTLNVHYYKSHRYCQKCSQDFQDQNEIVKHLETRHKHNLRCQICSFTSLDEIAVKIHIRHVHGLQLLRKSSQSQG